MCQHCCRMQHSPCEPIPYACPLCPVRQVAKHCRGPSRVDQLKRYHYPTPNSRPHKQSELCKGISELYSNVVANKRNVKVSTRRRRPFLSLAQTKERIAGGTAGRVVEQPSASHNLEAVGATPSLCGNSFRSTLNGNRPGSYLNRSSPTRTFYGNSPRSYLDGNIPVLYREPGAATSNRNETWTWKSRFPLPDKVTPVHARMAKNATMFGKDARPETSVSRILCLRRRSGMYP